MPIIDKNSNLDDVMAMIRKMAERCINKDIRLSVRLEELTITDQQRKALNLWCRQCGEICNDAGFYRHLPLTGKTVFWGKERDDWKEHVYKTFLKAYSGKESTMDQDRSEPCECYLALISHMMQEHGVQLPPWPDKFNRGGY